MEGATELHVLNQVGPLSLVGCNDANLVGFCSSFQQPCGYFLHIGSLSPAYTSRVITRQEQFISFDLTQTVNILDENTVRKNMQYLL